MNENNNTCKNFTPYLGITKKRGKLVSIFQLAKKGKMVVKVIHIDGSIARCNKNIEPAIKENRKERQLTLKYSKTDRVGI